MESLSIEIRKGDLGWDVNFRYDCHMQSKNFDTYMEAYKHAHDLQIEKCGGKAQWIDRTEE